MPCEGSATNPLQDPPTLYSTGRTRLWLTARKGLSQKKEEPEKSFRTNHGASPQARIHTHLQTLICDCIAPLAVVPKVQIVRAATMFSLLKYFFTYSAIIAAKFGHYIS